MAKDMTFQNSKGIIYGDFNFSLPSHMNYGKVFLDRILKYGNKIAMVDAVTKQEITFAEMAQNIVNVAYSLTQHGVHKGDVVAMCTENRIENITTAIAVLYSGAIFTAFNSAFKKDEIIHLMNISKPKYIFLSPSAYNTHYKTFKAESCIKQYFMFGEKDKRRSDVIYFEDLAETFVDMKLYEGAHFYGKVHTCLILYSSGTTGLPKGVNLTHLNYISTTYQPPITTRPLTMLMISPLTQAMGLICTTDSLFNGKTVVLLSKFVEDIYLQTIETYKVQYLLTAPSTVVALCKSSIIHKYDMSTLEIFLCGGAPMESETIEQFKTKFPNVKYMLQGYGMTETCAAISKETETANKLGSVGKLVVGIAAKIVDIETRNPLGPRKQGEILVKGTVIFDGYIGKNMDQYYEDGFFKTGDIAYYDDEGYIYIVGRLKELIKYKSWQVSPTELEAVLLKHPEIKDVAVVGIPDKEAGELPAAFVVKKPGSDVSGKEIADFVATKVSPWKKLRGDVHFIEEIPKNTNGKILRRLLLDLLIKPASKL